MALYLIRHADAGDRTSWAGDDGGRPLTSMGERTARALADLLADEGIDRVISSPAVRCVQTVQPLAESLGVEVETSTRLTEGAPASDLLVLLGEASGTTALCGHGDAIPEAIGMLAARGVVHVADVRCQKGSVWVLDTVEGAITGARYLAPPC